MAKEEKKIIIDEDWKTEAQKDKEDLVAEQHKEEVQEDQVRPQLPDADFTGLVSMLATQAFLSLGVIHPEDQEPGEPDFNLAKYNIDMLGVIEAKTKGNLSEDEKKLLESTLSQARMIFEQPMDSEGK